MISAGAADSLSNKGEAGDVKINFTEWLQGVRYNNDFFAKWFTGSNRAGNRILRGSEIGAFAKAAIKKGAKEGAIGYQNPDVYITGNPVR